MGKMIRLRASLIDSLKFKPIFEEQTYNKISSNNVFKIQIFVNFFGVVTVALLTKRAL